MNSPDPQPDPAWPFNCLRHSWHGNTSCPDCRAEPPQPDPVAPEGRELIGWDVTAEAHAHALMEAEDTIESLKAERDEAEQRAEAALRELHAAQPARNAALARARAAERKVEALREAVSQHQQAYAPSEGGLPCDCGCEERDAALYAALSEAQECDHEWTDFSNEAVKSPGYPWLCLKCGRIRQSEAQGDE